MTEEQIAELERLDAEDTEAPVFALTRPVFRRLLEERRRLLEALREAREAVLCGTLPLSADDAIAFAEEESR